MENKRVTGKDILSDAIIFLHNTKWIASINPVGSQTAYSKSYVPSVVHDSSLGDFGPSPACGGIPGPK